MVALDLLTFSRNNPQKKLRLAGEMPFLSLTRLLETSSGEADLAKTLSAKLFLSSEVAPRLSEASNSTPPPEARLIFYDFPAKKNLDISLSRTRSSAPRNAKRTSEKILKEESTTTSRNKSERRALSSPPF